MMLKKGDRVAVAMSGGVDSSVVAAIAKERGYDVFGITLQLYNQGDFSKKKGACCAGQDIYDAKRVCEILNIPHYVLDFEAKFQKDVIDEFVNSYVRGETPLPCVRCNQTVKFRDLLKTTKDLGAKALLTGHYVRKIEEGPELHEAFDKDQSYFLFTLTKEQLKFLYFPLGTINSKTLTREYAAKWKLPTSNKPDSQDICFVQGGKYTSIIEKFRPEALEKGSIVDESGKTIGTHNGIIHYTIGQRKGINLASSYPLYVVDLDPLNKRVIVGPKESLAKKTIMLHDTNWLISPCEKELRVKIRSSQPSVPARIKPISASRTEVTFEFPEYGVSKGQACVFYDGSRVLGGGWIN